METSWNGRRKDPSRLKKIVLALVKPISLLTSIALLLPQVSWCFQPLINSSMATNHILIHEQRFDLPKELGHVIDYQQNNKSTVIVIQDLHCHAEVQLNIAKIIDYLNKTHQLKLVGVEGSSGQLDVGKLRTFPIAKVRESAAYYLIQQGKINGAEYQAATGQADLILEGVEDAALYQASRQTVSSFMTDEIQGLLYDIRDGFDALKVDVYNENLANHDRAYQRYRQGKWSLLKVAGYLYKEALEQQFDLSAYPVVKQYLSKRHQAVNGTIDHTALVQQLQSLEHAVRQPLYLNSQEQQLDELLKRLDITEKLLNASVTNEELQSFLEKPQDYQVNGYINYIQTVNQSIYKNSLEYNFYDNHLINEALDQVRTFYLQADQRSDVFVEKLVNKMEDHQQQQAVLMIGGFHTARVLENLKERELSYIIIKPTLTKLDLINPYFFLLKNEKTALEQFLARSQNIIGLQSLFPTQAVARLPKEQWPAALRIFDDHLDLTLEEDTVSAGLQQGNSKLEALMAYVDGAIREYPLDDQAIRFDWQQAVALSAMKTYLIPVVVNETEMTALFSLQGLTLAEPAVNQRRAFNVQMQLLGQPLAEIDLNKLEQPRQKMDLRPIRLRQQVGPILNYLLNLSDQIEELLLMAGQSDAREPLLVPGGRWPHLQPFYNFLFSKFESSDLLKALDGQPTWMPRFLAMALIPALIESFLFVGLFHIAGTMLFDLPLASDYVFWTFYGSLKLIWHAKHYSGWSKIRSLPQLRRALGQMFSRPTLTITGLSTLGIVAVDYWFHPVGWVFASTYLSSLLLALILVDSDVPWMRYVSNLMLKIENNRTVELDNMFSLPGFWLHRLLFPDDTEGQRKWKGWKSALIDLTLLGGVALLWHGLTPIGLVEIGLLIIGYAVGIQLLKGFAILKTDRMVERGGVDIFFFFSGLFKQIIVLSPYLPALWMLATQQFTLFSVLLIGLSSLILGNYYARFQNFVELIYQHESRKELNIADHVNLQHPAWISLQRAINLIDEETRTDILNKMEAIARQHEITQADVDKDGLNWRNMNTFWPEAAQQKQEQAALAMKTLFESYNDHINNQLDESLRPYFWIGMIINHIYRDEYDGTTSDFSFSTFLHSWDMAEMSSAAVNYVQDQGITIGHDNETPGPNEIFLAALIHDYGKRFCDQQMVHYQGRFSDPWQRVLVASSHARMGYSVLEALEPFLTFTPDPSINPGRQARFQEAALHHEHLDGSGYPFQLTGEQVTPIMRILKIIDVYQATTDSNRAFYRNYKGRMEKIFYGIIFEFIKWALTDHQLDTKWIQVFFKISVKKLSKPDTSGLIQPKGYNSDHPRLQTDPGSLDKHLVYAALGRKPIIDVATLREYLKWPDDLAGLTASDYIGDRPWLRSDDPITLVNDMVTIVGDMASIGKPELSKLAIRMLDLLEDADQPQLVNYTAAYTLRSIQHQVNQKVKKKIMEKVGKRNGFDMLGITHYPGHLARIRQFLSKDSMAVALLTEENSSGVNVNIIGPPTADAAEIAAAIATFNFKAPDRSQISRNHHVVVSEAIVPHLIIKDFRDHSARGFAFFDQDGQIMGLFDEQGHPNHDLAAKTKFITLYTRYVAKARDSYQASLISSNSERFFQPANIQVMDGISFEFEPYHTFAHQHNMSLKEAAFGSGVTARIKIIVNKLGTYPGEEDMILKQMAQDLEEEGLIITGAPLIPNRYNTDDAQFTVYRKVDGQLKPLGLYLVKAGTRYGFSVEHLSLQQAELMGHAVVAAMKNDNWQEAIATLGFDLNSIEQTSLSEVKPIDLEAWRQTVQKNLGLSSQISSFSETAAGKVEDLEQKRKKRDDDQNPPGASTGETGNQRGNIRPANNDGAMQFTAVKPFNQGLYSRPAESVKLMRWLLSFIFFAQDGTTLKMGYRLPLQALSMLIGIPVMGLRLMLAALVNQTSTTPTFDQNHPAIRQLLWHNNLPEPVALEQLAATGLKLPKIMIKPLSELPDRSWQDWAGRYVAGGEMVGGIEQPWRTFYLPDQLLTMLLTTSGQGSQSGWRAAGKRSAQGLLSLCISRLQIKNNDRLRVDHLLLALDQPIKQSWSKPLSNMLGNMISMINVLPSAMKRRMHQRLRQLNSAGYLQLILKNHQLPPALPLLQRHHPLAQAFQLWSAAPSALTRNHFLDQLNQTIETEWTRLVGQSASSPAEAKPELIELIQAVSMLARSIPECEGELVGKWESPDTFAGQAIYLPKSTIGNSAYEEGVVLDRLEQMPGLIIDQQRFQRFERQRRDIKHDMAA